MPPSLAEREALLLARQALLVINPEVASLRDAQQVKRLVTAQIGGGRVLTVLNKASMAGGLSLELVSEGLGWKPDMIIPELSKNPRACRQPWQAGRQ